MSANGALIPVLPKKHLTNPPIIIMLDNYKSNTTVMKKRSTSYKPSERAVHWLKGGPGRV
ncbi:MAG: hypothetical protein LUK37_01240 [Clostridia bacterium]|nr:hypothetical protein [Clostridia bacterium]